MITYNEALERLLKAAVPVTRTETVPTLYAEGRILAAAVKSTVDVPPWDNSQMDGYCLRAEDIAGATEASPVRLPVSQRIPAGSLGTALAARTCARIFTGAPMPPAADTVVAQEDVERDGDEVIFKAPAQEGTFVRRRAGDVAAGDVVAEAGEKLTPGVLGLIASVGAAYVTVVKPLRVAVFFSGSELAMPGDPLPAGGIYNSNRYTIRALLKGLGCEVYDLGTVPDSFEKTQEALSKASRETDLIITSGGMSVGEEDHIKPAVERLGKIDMWRVCLKPGKPVAFGEVKGVPFIGLPGNPVSSFVTFLMLARAFILRRQGVKNVRVMPLAVRADFTKKADAREEFVRVRRNEQGGLDLYRTQNSQILASCAWADGLADIPAGAEVKPGDMVSYYPFRDLFL